jgi:hypothetical protein
VSEDARTEPRAVNCDFSLDSQTLKPLVQISSTWMRRFVCVFNFNRRKKPFPLKSTRLGEAFFSVSKKLGGVFDTGEETELTNILDI